MGYQVGATCYPEKALAENVYFSQVVPVIHDNKLQKIEYKQGAWYFNDHKQEISLPQCSPKNNVLDGQMLAMELVPTAVLLATSIIVIRLFR